MKRYQLVILFCKSVKLTKMYISCVSQCFSKNTILKSIKIPVIKFAFIFIDAIDVNISTREKEGKKVGRKFKKEKI